MPSAKPRVVNQQLAQLETELNPLAKAGKLDGYGSYAYAIVLRELQRNGEVCNMLAILSTVPLLGIRVRICWFCESIHNLYIISTGFAPAAGPPC